MTRRISVLLLLLAAPAAAQGRATRVAPHVVLSPTRVAVPTHPSLALMVADLRRQSPALAVPPHRVSTTTASPILAAPATLTLKEMAWTGAQSSFVELYGAGVDFDPQGVSLYGDTYLALNHGLPPGDYIVRFDVVPDGIATLRLWAHRADDTPIMCHLTGPGQCSGILHVLPVAGTPLGRGMYSIHAEDGRATVTAVSIVRSPL